MCHTVHFFRKNLNYKKSLKFLISRPYIYQLLLLMTNFLALPNNSNQRSNFIPFFINQKFLFLSCDLHQSHLIFKHFSYFFFIFNIDQEHKLLRTAIFNCIFTQFFVLRCSGTHFSISGFFIIASILI